MVSINLIILLGGLLLLLGIASSKFSARFGIPVLLLFLGIGMLAGSEGVGGIAFEDYALANSIGSISLAMILFDGGLRTPLGSVKRAWRPALSLSTVGVLLTTALVAAAAVWILGVPPLYGILLGGIVGSTDAAAVFSVLRTSGLALPERLTATLEVESGSNDPMAVFLTLGLVGVLAQTEATIGALLLLFVLQFGIGAIVGVGVGRTAAWVINRINLNHSGLYPLLVMSFGLLAFGLAAVFQGSGFLAVYIAGILLGNSDLVFKRGTFLFHDAIAWLSQIVLFIMLGLLSFPSRLLAIADNGFLIALVMILIARPIAVIVSVVWFRFRWSEMLFLSWAGLKGAVPITLATFPLMAGIPNSEPLFNVVFFVVLVSAVAQGWTLPTLARRLKLGQPVNPPPLSLEINSLRRVDGEIVDYTVAANARVAGKMLNHLALPDGVLVTLIVREGEILMPRGATIIREGDHVYIAMRIHLKPFVDNLFGPHDQRPSLTPRLEFSFPAERTAVQLHWFFNLPTPPWPSEPMSRLLEAEEENEAISFAPFTVTLDQEANLVMLQTGE